MICLDTHTLVWMALLPSKLSEKAAKYIENETEFLIADISLWEIAILQHLGKIDLNERFDYWANRLLKKQGFGIIPLEISVIKNAVGFIASSCAVLIR